tara:strand:+ start:284 stop:475 length:192 start_codon:yes stop_codon:yes gene_type:complete
MNHIIGTAIMNTNCNCGAKLTNGKYKPVKTTANAPETSVARWFFTYPNDERKNLQNITLMVDF